MFPLDHDDHGNGYVETDPTGQYGRFDEVLGKGAMKTVYRAFDEVNGTEVAWNQAKLCAVAQSPDALQRMYSEVHLLSRLSHHAVIRFHASWVDVSARAFNFITEMFTSGTLRQYRRRYRRVDLRVVKNWARQILEGLAYLHSHEPPVIHRDLKCDNIFVNGHLGQVKIGDLGLAAVLRESHSAHSVIGTPEFMAPELYEEEYNELVDIYSFGMCLLEMLTAEYPYSECSNPAQIYKKVTSGKLPDAFYRLHDLESRRFIGGCLGKASNRSSAKQLLLDPFLQCDDHTMPLCPAVLKTKGSILRRLHGQDFEACDREQPTNMTITGTMNPDDDAIYLKVQINDKGKVRNIYFPFDIISDTPIDVANEMVNELEINDWEPAEISNMIKREIMNLVPNWRELDDEGNDHRHHVYEFGEDDEFGHPFCYLSGSPSSTHESPVFGAAQSTHQGPWLGDPNQIAEWLQEDDSSSVHSAGKCSAINYTSCNEQDDELSYAEPITKPTRHCSKDSQIGIDTLLPSKLQRQCTLLQSPAEFSRCSAGRAGKRLADGRRLQRNRSMVDMRSQLLHRTLVEEVNKRLFKTVGDVENIGFEMPCDASYASSSSKMQVKRRGKS